MTILFVDTNLFLQCKDIKNIEWDTLFPKETLKLLIPRAVQKEIDNFKGQGNSRRAKRAKTASSYFKQILAHDDGLPITAQVSVSFTSSRELSKIPKETSLDCNKSDDSIIQDILSYQTLHPDETVKLLTNDSGLMVSAREYGIAYIDIPESCLLEAEPDERDKKVNELEKKIKALESNYPDIKLQANTADEKNLNLLRIQITKYPKLSVEEIDSLTTIIQQHYPLIRASDTESITAHNIDTLVSRALMKAYEHPPSDRDVEEYTNTLYPAWVDKIRASLSNIHFFIYAHKNMRTVDISMTNEGQAPAEGVIFDVSITNGFKLYHKSEDDLLTKGWPFPKPPEAPKRRVVNSYHSLIDSINSISNPKLHINPIRFSQPVRDPNFFYWKSEPSSFEDKWIKECEEFRHQISQETTSLSIFPIFDAAPTGGKISCSVSARNMPNPEKLSITLDVKFETGKTYEEALKIINRKIATESEPK